MRRGSEQRRTNKVYEACCIRVPEKRETSREVELTEPRAAASLLEGLPLRSCCGSRRDEEEISTATRSPLDAAGEPQAADERLAARAAAARARAAEELDQEHQVRSRPPEPQQQPQRAGQLAAEPKT